MKSKEIKEILKIKSILRIFFLFKYILIICDYWTVFPKSKKALSSKYKINSWEVLALDLGYITKSLIVTELNTTNNNLLGSNTLDSLFTGKP